MVLPLNGPGAAHIMKLPPRRATRVHLEAARKLARNGNLPPGCAWLLLGGGSSSLAAIDLRPHREPSTRNHVTAVARAAAASCERAWEVVEPSLDILWRDRTALGIAQRVFPDVRLVAAMVPGRELEPDACERAAPPQTIDGPSAGVPALLAYAGLLLDAGMAATVFATGELGEEPRNGGRPGSRELRPVGYVAQKARVAWALCGAGLRLLVPNANVDEATTALNACAGADAGWTVSGVADTTEAVQLVFGHAAAQWAPRWERAAQLWLKDNDKEGIAEILRGLYDTELRARRGPRPRGAASEAVIAAVEQLLASLSSPEFAPAVDPHDRTLLHVCKAFAARHAGRHADAARWMPATLDWMARAYPRGGAGLWASVIQHAIDHGVPSPDMVADALASQPASWFWDLETARMHAALARLDEVRGREQEAIALQQQVLGVLGRVLTEPGERAELSHQIAALYRLAPLTQDAVARQLADRTRGELLAKGVLAPTGERVREWCYVEAARGRGLVRWSPDGSQRAQGLAALVALANRQDAPPDVRGAAARELGRCQYWEAHQTATVFARLGFFLKQVFESLLEADLAVAAGDEMTAQKAMASCGLPMPLRFLGDAAPKERSELQKMAWVLERFPY